MMRFVESNFFLPRENISDAFISLKMKRASFDRAKYFWVNKYFWCAENLNDMLVAWGWTPKYYNGDIVALEFNRKAIHYDDHLFEILAPFVDEDSYILLLDFEYWALFWEFKNNSLIKKYPNKEIKEKKNSGWYFKVEKYLENYEGMKEFHPGFMSHEEFLKYLKDLHEDSYFLDDETKPWILAWIVRKEYYDKNNHFEDRHITNDLKNDFPDFDGGEEQESLFSFEGTYEEVCNNLKEMEMIQLPDVDV